MSHKRLWAASAIIALVVIVGFALSVPHTRDVAKTSSSENKTAIVPRVTLHDVFKKGVHTITGSLDAPNACASVNAIVSPVTDSSGTVGILVELSLPEDTGVCLQVTTRESFSTTISAPARLPITATVNGSPASTTNI